MTREHENCTAGPGSGRVEHGETAGCPCLTAACDHCGWEGEMPSGRTRKPARKLAPKKATLALDVATLRWCAAEIVVEAAQKAFDSLRWDNLAKRLRAKAARIEKERSR